jgi:hypothetical protein
MSIRGLSLGYRRDASRFARAVGSLVVCVLAVGCGQAIEKRACMKVGTRDPLVTGAQLFRLDVYGAGIKCAGNNVVSGTGAPQMSHTYAKGQAIAIDVPPGPHTLVLTTYADKNGQMELGQGCTQTTLTPGAEICFDLSLTVPAREDMAATQDFAAVDLSGSVVDLAMQPCTTGPDTCPLGFYCVAGGCTPGCKSDVDCAGGVLGPDGGSLGTSGCCNHACTSLETTSNCGGCGNLCDTVHSSGASCVNQSCSYASCAAGYADCNTTAPNTNGCETNTNTDVDNCGACKRACSSSEVATRHCSGGLCDSTCLTNFGNCHMPAAGSTPPYVLDDGCESKLLVCTGQACCTITMPTPAGMCAPPATGSNAHVDGIGSQATTWGATQTYAACEPIGTPGDATTYDSIMAAAAQAAYAATVTSPKLTSGMCGNANCVNVVGSGSCIAWCYQNDTSTATVAHIAGHLYKNTSNTKCFCPSETDPSWN